MHYGIQCGVLTYNPSLQIEVRLLTTYFPFSQLINGLHGSKLKLKHTQIGPFSRYPSYFSLVKLGQRGDLETISNTVIG